MMDGVRVYHAELSMRKSPQDLERKTEDSVDMTGWSGALLQTIKSNIINVMVKQP